MTDARDLMAAAIEKSGYKKKAVAQKAGMSAQQLSDIIGHRRRLDANEMLRLCDALNVTPNDLFGIPPPAD